MRAEMHAHMMTHRHKQDIVGVGDRQVWFRQSHNGTIDEQFCFYLNQKNLHRLNVFFFVLVGHFMHNLSYVSMCLLVLVHIHVNNDCRL